MSVGWKLKERRLASEVVDCDDEKECDRRKEQREEKRKKLRAILTSEQLQGAEGSGVLGRFQYVGQKAGGGSQQSKRADHRDRDTDPHGDGARLPPGARNVPEAKIKYCLYCSRSAAFSLNCIVDKIPRKLNFKL